MDPDAALLLKCICNIIIIDHVWYIGMNCMPIVVCWSQCFNIYLHYCAVMPVVTMTTTACSGMANESSTCYDSTGKLTLAFDIIIMLCRLKKTLVNTVVLYALYFHVFRRWTRRFGSKFKWNSQTLAWRCVWSAGCYCCGNCSGSLGNVSVEKKRYIHVKKLR